VGVDKGNEPVVGLYREIRGDFDLHGEWNRCEPTQGIWITKKTIQGKWIMFNGSCLPIQVYIG